MKPLLKIGIGSIALAAIVYGGWICWMKTRRWVAVDIPITLSPGTIRAASFKTNIPTPHLIEIEAQKTIPFDTLNCLLGMASVDPSAKCTNASDSIDINWEILADGKMFAQGTSQDDHGGGWAADTISREIGSFTPRSGQQYQLNVTVSKDASQLRAANPHLKVSASPDYLEGMMFWGAFRIYPAIAFLLLLGVISLIASFIVKLSRSIMSRPSTGK